MDAEGALLWKKKQKKIVCFSKRRSSLGLSLPSRSCVVVANIHVDPKTSQCDPCVRSETLHVCTCGYHIQHHLAYMYLPASRPSPYPIPHTPYSIPHTSYPTPHTSSHIPPHSPTKAETLHQISVPKRTENGSAKPSQARSASDFS